jgi:AhpD family alkylhydroperoxidase
LSPAERQLVLLAASVVNECAYCVAAHSTAAKGMLKVPATVVAAVRAGELVARRFGQSHAGTRAGPRSCCHSDHPVVPECRLS